MRVIVAIEPRFYREVMGRAVRALRPHLGVAVLEPSTLWARVERLVPGIVFANGPDPCAYDGRSAWVELRPYAPARVCLAGRRWELEEVDLEDLLSLVDEAEELWRAGREPGGR